MNRSLSWLPMMLLLWVVGVAHAGGDGNASSTHTSANSVAQAASAKTVAESSKRAQAAAMKSTPSPSRHKSYASPAWTRSVVITLYPGSLYQNVERIAHQYGWYNVVWSVPNDYDWVGTTRIAADSLTGAFNKALSGYPVQAVFYMGNRVLLIRPRTLQ